MKTEDLRRGDKVRVRHYTQYGIAVVSGTITGFTADQVIVRADPQFPNAGMNGIVHAWYSDVLSAVAG